MSQTYIALDLETTGLDPDRDRITEVGAVRFTAEGDVVEVFEALVNPGREIPFFVENLTGITNEAVRDAPSISRVGLDLKRFVADDLIIGQNIGFDLGYLRREGVPLDAGSVDTAELSRLLMPLRQARGLMDLAETLGVEPEPHHRALADAKTTARVFLALVERANGIPLAQRLQLARLVSLQNLALAEVIAGPGWAEVPIEERLLPSVRPTLPLPTLEKREPRTAITSAEVAKVFAAGRAEMERFEERREQRDMADAVRGALSDGGHWLIEAGTGVGKSLAYLVPAALHALRNGERVVVSTNTINLQEQLLSKDIPALRRMLKRAGVIADESEFRAVVLKGRSNYLCLRRWVASYGSSFADPDFSRLGASMLLWLPETESGDRSELNLDHDGYVTWQRFSAQDTDCLSRPNQYVRDGLCFLSRARKAAESAHILIVNHALLLADIASNGSALPSFDHLVVDEAHNLEDQATQQFGGSVSRRLLAEALEGLHRRGGRDQREGGVATLLKAFPEGAVTASGRAMEAAVATALRHSGPCFEALASELPGNGEDDRLLVNRSVRARASWANVEQAWSELDRPLAELGRILREASMLVIATSTVEQADAIAGEIDSAGRKVDELKDLLGRLVSSNDDGTIVWIGRERDRTGSLNSAPLEVGPTLWEHLFAKRLTVIATSATLSAAGNMDYAAKRLGLEAPETLQLGSPYDYERSTLLAAFTDVPEPNAPGYVDAVARAVARLVKASEGRALALFTSHASLRQVAELVRPEMEEAGITVLAQGVDGSPRQLIDNLKDNPRTLVLGTSSFWEGVDVRGEALSMLIIARLPFSVPTDPVYRARSEQYDNPFTQYALPGAILKFRQGFGRLIRDRDDRGVVAVLDRRIYDKQYGRDFVDALPKCTTIRGDSEAVARRAREWLEPE
ncbi:MAG TPA: helicase C-terminal domain-containing protein [Tepidiformaceae bacterium]